MADLGIGASSDIFVDDFLKRRIAMEFNLKDTDQRKFRHQIERLVMWAKAKKNVKDDVDAIWEIKQLASKSGSPKLGNNWMQHLSNIVYLEMEREKIDNELKTISTPELHGNDKRDSLEK